VSWSGNRHLTRSLDAWVDFARRRAAAVVAGVLSSTVLIALYTAFHLGVDSDNMAMIDPELPFMRNNREFARDFPTLDSALLVVIDAETPELARRSAAALEGRLASLGEYFEDVYVPGGSRFFEEHGLLYRDAWELDEFATGMARAQPVLAELERDNSIANFARLVRHGLDAVKNGDADGAEWPAILERISHATVVVYQEFPVAISWDEVLLRGSAIDVVTRRVIVLHPLLDFGNLLAAGSSMRAIRDAARELELDPQHGVRVRITGNPALNYEEMVGLLWDIGGAGLFCFLLVVSLVYLALRSLKLVLAVVGTLLVGLVWTAGFAAASVGDLNLASIAFAILFIGLGVDFGIHLAMRYGDLLAQGQAHEDALRGAGRSVGSSLVLCTVTTAVGFYVFVPTEFRGVAELGLISGTGMVIVLFLTLTFLPALLSSWLRLDAGHPRRQELRFRIRWWSAFEHHPRAVRWSAAVAAAGALALLPRAYFEANVVDMRDPTTESVQAFNDLLGQAGTMSPWFVNAVAPDLDAARALAERLRAHDEVDLTLTLADFVPEDQAEKIEILQDLGLMLDAPPAPPGALPAVSPEAQVQALAELHAFLDAGWIEGIHTPLARSMRHLRSQLGHFLGRIARDGNAREVMADFQEVLLSTLPQQAARLRKALDTPRIGLDDLPDDLRRRMLAPDGRARIQIFPAGDLQQRGGLQRFSDAVLELAPDAVGVTVNLTGFARVTVASFQQALISAILIIGLLLWLVWRRPSDVTLALAPLLLAAALTVASMALLDIPFSFFNVVVIPLLFGVGVDSGIHLVHQSRQPGGGDELLATTTARAVFYSAVTTTASFGSLALSDHRGVRSLGILLTVGMFLTVVCNLVVLPALLELRRARRPAAPR
jgi:hopanoid biosynthesis associated RND transporter like protein HpnN